MQPELSDQQLLLLLEKYRKGECSAQEQQALESWYDAFESRLNGAEQAPSPNLPAMYHNIIQHLKEEQEWAEATPAKARSIWWKAAAAVFLVLAGALGAFLLRPAKLLEVSTLAGNHSVVTLPDGTQVWLNVSSRLQYSPRMQNGNREVYLEGEGYFDVARKEQHPFIIHTSDITVKVLGTSFNLKAYTGDETLETTLLQGKVAVSLNKDPGKNLLLAPQEKLTLTRKPAAGKVAGAQQDWGDFAAEIQPMKRNGEVETMWRDNRMEFRDKSFAELARIMGRWYGKTIILQDTSLNSNRFNGVFRREDITQALEALQITADFRYKIKGDTVFIHK